MNITIATDGCIEAEIAVAVMEKLPLPQNAELSVAMVNAIPALVGASIASPSCEAGDISEVQAIRIGRQVAERTVERVVDKLRLEGFISNGVVVDGDPAKCILELIDETKSELVVTGCGTNSNIDAFFIGSVSRKLIQSSGSSVLIGRPFASGRKPDGSHACLKSKPKLDVLIAVDGSSGSDFAVKGLSNLRSQPFQNIYVMAVEPFTVLPDAPFLASRGEPTPTWGEEIALRAASKLVGAAERIEVITGFGHPSTEIRSAAQKYDIDLIIMGAQRHGALERLMLGSCAYETAIKAPCSVMLLRDELPFVDRTLT